MTDILGNILLLAVGVALSSAPIIAVIILLFGRNARGNGLAFMAGWISGEALVTGLAVAGTIAGRITFGDDTKGVYYVARLILGVVMLYLAYWSWQKRPKPGETPEPPAWMTAVDSFTPRNSFGFAFFLSVANPKNLALTLAAATIIAEAALSSLQTWVAGLVFVVTGSLCVIVPVGYYLLARSPAERWLASLKARLITDNTRFSVILFLVFGILLVVKGLTGLVN